MRKVFKVLSLLFAALVVVLIGGFGYVEATYQRDYGATPLPAIRASSDPAVIAQGKYIVDAVAHCSACHGPGEIVKERDRRILEHTSELRGGYVFEAGPFGKFVASNISSDPVHGLGNVSDGHVARAIRHGVDRHGRFAAFMSFAVGEMSDEDLTAVVSYLRSVSPHPTATEPEAWGPIAKLLAGKFQPRVGAIPTHVAASSTPTVERGAYLANGPAHCGGCHTQLDPMAGLTPVGARFSGEPQAEPDPFDDTHELVTPNLTPDPETGVMANWSEDQFVERFRAGRVYKGSKMPWENFSLMTEADLRSIYRYLRTVPPTKKLVGPSWRPAGWKPS